MQKTESLNIVYLNGADNISISSNSSGGQSQDNPFTIIGYEVYPQQVLNDIEYSKQQQQKYESGEISSFAGDTNLVYSPKVDIYGTSTYVEEPEEPEEDEVLGFFQGCIRLVSIPSIGIYGLTNFSNLFYDDSKLLAIPEIFVEPSESLKSTFYNCSSLSKIDFDLNSSNCTDFSSTFESCKNLKSIKSLDTSNGRTFSKTFYSCQNLEELPEGLDTSKATSMDYMFCKCSKITKIPETVVIPKTCTVVPYLFQGCTSLTEYPSHIDISHCTNINSMFSITGISEFPKLDITKAGSNSQYLFRGSPLTEVPDLTCSSSNRYDGMFSYALIKHAVVPEGLAPTYAIDMFRGCGVIETIDFQGFKPSYFERIAYDCERLKKVINLDLANAKRISYLFGVSTGPANTSITYIDLRNLGQSTLTSYDFSYVGNWGVGTEEDRQSLIDSLIVNSYDRAGNGKSAVTVKLSATTKAVLTESEIAQITQKGFTIT